jgi:hypothetical protein
MEEIETKKKKIQRKNMIEKWHGIERVTFWLRSK